ncbi:MAG: glycogen debranching protein GlgX [Actinomycetota bacterium]|jgi:glycogen operon protein|nr:glycogen debranching protein GlgX [Actinomycetota bacterium]
MTDSRVTAAPPLVRPGQQAPLGATYHPEATTFAVWAADASGVELCLYDEAGRETREPVREHSLGVWHCRIPGVMPGQRYGFRVHGPWDPGRGRRFNPAKLLLDPYARAITGPLDPREEVYATAPGGERDDRDSAPFVPRSVVVADDGFDWGDDRRPDLAWADTVIYELHVKGFTQQHPAVPPSMRGTYAGLAHPEVVGYLVDLGITSVQLLPVQQFLSEPALTAGGLSNYWGYNTIGFFAPHAAYAATGSTGQQVREFRQLVTALHAAGIEVLLDVVYNHTAEGPVDGPVLAFRGYGDADYYRHEHTGRYLDVTGCGNTVDAGTSPALTLILDSLRYWVREMHVDGFRFDLAPALTRNGRHVDLRSPFLSALGQDPLLREVKLIAEPWDVTAEGYQLGRFPPPWCEWNDRFRDTVRDFWRGRPGSLADLGTRLSGSSDLYGDDGRRPYASVNYVSAHDGFTLRDLVSYDHKHNEDNGEHNRDGTEHNRSWNCGAEGDTGDPAVLALRHRQAANLIATLLLASGVPMLVAGDERGRTQRGNNNAFCQDNENSWVDWTDSEGWSALHSLTRQLLMLRRDHPVLRQLSGSTCKDGGGQGVSWVHPDGREMGDADWWGADLQTVGFFLAGDTIRVRGPDDEPTMDTSYLVWLHAGAHDQPVTLPALADHYDEVLRTDGTSSGGATPGEPPRHGAGAALLLSARSLVLLRAD